MDYASLVENGPISLLSVVYLILFLKTGNNQHCLTKCLDMVDWESHGKKDSYFICNWAIICGMLFCNIYFNCSFVLGFVDSMDIKCFQPN